MEPQTNLDLLRKKYIDDLAVKGIELDSAQLTRLNEVISKKKSVQAGLTQSDNTSLSAKQNKMFNPAGNLWEQAQQSTLMGHQASSPGGQGSTLRTLGVGLWYGLESYLWETPGLALKKFGIEEPFAWDDLSGAEKAAAVTGGGGALFIPGLGGFRGLTKLLSFGAKRVPGGLVKGISNTADKVITESALRSAVKGVNKKVINSKKFKDNAGAAADATRKAVKKEIIKSQGTVAGAKAVAEAADEAKLILAARSRQAIIKALEESGLGLGKKRIAGIADELGAKFTKEVLENGANLGSISEVVGRLIGGSVPGRTREAISKYLGMAANDVLLLGIHGSTSKYLQSLTDGTDMRMSDIMMSTLYMSAAFPAVRMVGSLKGGSLNKFQGNKTLGEGWKSLRDYFKRINYEKTAERLGENADGTLKHLLKSMLNGTHKDLYNKSVLKDVVYKYGNKSDTGSQILSKLDDLTLPEVIEVLGSVRKHTVNATGKAWMKDYAMDFIGSGPRMAIGSMAMNLPSWAGGEFMHMEPQEMYAHMVMGGLMTKSRGEWGKDAAHQNQINFHRYIEAMRSLDMSPESLETMFIFHQARKDVGKLLHGPGTEEIIQVFEDVISKQSDLVGVETPTGDKGFNSFHHKLVADFANLYNAYVLASPEAGKKTEIDVRKLNRDQLGAMKEKLEAIELDGTPIGELGFRGAQAKISEMFGGSVKEIYLNMFRELEGLNFPVRIELGPDGKDQLFFGDIEVGPTDSSHEKLSAVTTVRDIMKLLELPEIGIAKKHDATLNIADKKTAEKIDNAKVQEVLDRYEKHLVQEFYPNSKQRLESYEGEPDMSNNVYLDLMVSSKQWKSANDLYNFIVGRDIGQNNLASNFRGGFENLFVKGGAHVKDWDKQVIFDKAEPKDATKAKKEEIAKKGQEKPTTVEEEEFYIMHRDMKQIWNLMNTMRQSRNVHNEVIKVTHKDMKALHQTFKDSFGQFPEGMLIKGVGFLGEDYFLSRFFDKLDLPPESVYLFKASLDNGFVVADGRSGKFFVSSDKSVEAMMRKDKTIEEGGEYWNEVKKAASEIRKEFTLMEGVTVEDFILSPSELSGGELRTPQASDIITMHEGRMTDSIKNLGKDVGKALDILASITDTSMEVEVAKLVDLLDGGLIKDITMEDRISTLVSMRDALGNVIEVFQGKDKNQQNKYAIKAFKNALKETKKYLKKVSQVDDRNVDQLVTEEGVEAGYELYISTIREHFLEGVSPEIHAKNELRRIITEIYGYTRNGALSVYSSMTHLDNLKGELMEHVALKGKDGKNNTAQGMTLAQVVEEFNNHRGNSYALLQTGIERIERGLNFKKNNIVKDADFVDVRNRFKTLLHRTQRRDDIKTAVQIAQEYNLTEPGDRNKISMDVIEDISNARNPGDKMSSIIRERLLSSEDYSSYSDHQRDQLIKEKIDEFHKRDGLTLLTYAVNTRRIKSASFKDGNLILEPQDSRFTSPLVEFLMQFENGDNGSVFYLNQSASLPSLVSKENAKRSWAGPRRQQINIWSLKKGHSLQDYIDDVMAGNVKDTKLSYSHLEEGLYREVKPSTETKEWDVSPKEYRRPERLHFIRIGNTSFLFEPSKANQDILNGLYSHWYETNLKSLSSRNRKAAFKTMWEPLLDGGEGSNSARNNELKMSVLFVENTLKKGFMEEYLDPAVYKNPEERRMWESMTHQRAALASGGTSQAMSKQVINYMMKRTDTWGAVKNDLKQYRDEGIRYGILADERKDVDGNWVESSPFHVRSLVKRAWKEVASSGKTKAEREDAQQMLYELEADMSRDPESRQLPSLDASSVDGIMYVSERFMKVLSAMKGRDLDEYNGIKPYTFFNSSEGKLQGTLLAKGYYVYDPEIAAQMKDVDVLIGQSAAKYMSDDIVPMVLKGNKNNWISDIAGMKADSKINVNIESVGLGVINIDKNVASRSHSIGDYQSSGYMEELRTWQGLRNTMDEISLIDKQSSEGDQILSRIMFEAKSQEGMNYTEGAISLAEKLVNVGMSSNNDVIRHTIKRFLHGPFLNILKSMNNPNSLDAMIAPDKDGTLKLPIFMKAGTVDGNGKATEISNRVQLELGEVDLPTNMHKMDVKSIDDLTFVFKSGGVDVLVGTKGGKGHHRSPIDDLVEGEHIVGLEKNSKGNLKRDTTTGNLEYFQMDRKERKSDTARSKKIVEAIYEWYERFDRPEGPSRPTFAEINNVVRAMRGDSISEQSLGSFKKGRLVGGVAYRILQKAGVRPQDAKNMSFGLTTEGFPIPRVGYDLSTLRVRNVGEKTTDFTDGKIVRINAYDQRIGFQRDNDGDRFYLNFDRGLETMATNVRNFAKVVDYQQMPKNPPDINLFGIDVARDTYVAGTNVDSGVGRYAGIYDQQKLNVGSAIGLKSALTHLSNAKMTMSFRIGSDKKLTPFDMLDISKIKYVEGDSPAARQYNAVVRQFIFNQSSVDVNKGTNDVAREGRDVLIDAMLFGEMPDNATVMQNPEFYKIAKENSLFYDRTDKQNPFTDWTPASKAVVKEVLRMMRRGSRIFNDVYDESGGRQASDRELKEAYADLRVLFGDAREANRAIFNKLMKGAGGPDFKLDVMKLFYGEEALAGLKDYITKGTYGNDVVKNMAEIFNEGVPEQFNTDKVIEFRYGKNLKQPDATSERIALSQAGHILQELSGKRYFNPDKSVWGEIPGKYRRVIGDTAERFISGLEMLEVIGQKSLNDILRTEMAEMFDYETHLDTRMKVKVNPALKRGAIFAALNAEKRSLETQKRWYQGERYPPNDVLVVSNERRLLAVNRALDHVKEQSLKGLVAEAGNYRRVPSLGKDADRPKTHYMKSDTYVWRYTGRPEERLFDNAGNISIDLKSLEFVANVQKDKSYQQYKGYNYIELKNPLMPSTMDSASLKQSYSLLGVTQGFGVRDVLAFAGRNVKEGEPGINKAVMEREYLELYKKTIDTINFTHAESSIMGSRQMGRPRGWSRATTRNQLAIKKLMDAYAWDKSAGEYNEQAVIGIMRHLLRPSTIEGFTPIDLPSGVQKEMGTSIDMPSFRVNRRVVTETLDWAFSNDFGGRKPGDRNNPVSELVEQWQALSEGITPEFVYNKRLAENPYRRATGTDLNERDLNLARHLYGFTDPIIRQYFDRNGAIIETSLQDFENAEGIGSYIRFLRRGKIRKRWCRTGSK